MSHTTHTGSWLAWFLARDSLDGFEAFVVNALHRNGRPLAHIPDSGVVYADMLGRNREMYSMRPKNHCTSW